MTEESAAAAITKWGWRQVSVLGRLLANESREHAPHWVKVDETDWLIVTSHDCDISNSSLEKEPVVEVLRASIKLSPPDGRLQSGRNPRFLRLQAETDGLPVDLHCNIHDRWMIPRKLLTKEAPCPGVTGKSLRVMVEWLAKRYIRAAFPTEFDRRRKAKVKEWEALLKKNSAWIQGVYLRLDTSAELAEDKPYCCHLIFTVPAEMRKGPRWATERDRLENEASTFWQQFEPGIVCDGVDVLGTDELTLADIEWYQRFDADWVSLADESPSTPGVVDMRT